ncbi:piggyBac transposable element-derived protein 3 [Austrofundulus limnaeus]|uniref:PiggyBac transposable element-derived protein 3 n=1 Tax=Austrofundulus limnaeus TaxID=52670 RepID=A0A2I4ALS6_AUSLI|nr:PREDICTED: piggyBac transposable element-derived protein 3-like [Austrofundulus limnaeus]
MHVGPSVRSVLAFQRRHQTTCQNQLRGGDMRWLRKDGLLFVKWKDTKEVTTCSTFHKAYSGATVRRRVKEGGQWCVKDIPVPDAVRDYNKFMGGVDFSDALIQYYSVRGKTMKWYKTFFYHFIDIAVVNSFIMLKMLAAGNGESPLTQKQFREVLMKELVEASKVTVPTPKPSPSDICMPAYYAQSATDKRRKCVACKQQGRKTKTPVYCTKCDVALCITSSRNCFLEYHCKV